MPTKEEIDGKYLEQVNALESEYFYIVDEGLPTQHRELESGKLIADFNLIHGQIWQDHAVELIASGFLQPQPAPMDWQLKWDAAAPGDKIKILASMLGLKVGGV